ncbi:hypothetical protein [Nostoc sp. PCC 9305]|uniref:hypothetical protein n=1 Tax=Nostoc sp. PCC 9305 TaxID=296636 RepID=UPI0039C6CF4B
MLICIESIGVKIDKISKVITKAIDITSNDDGKTLTGTITYAGEGPIGFRSHQI